MKELIIDNGQRHNLQRIILGGKHAIKHCVDRGIKCDIANLRA